MSDYNISFFKEGISEIVSKKKDFLRINEEIERIDVKKLGELESDLSFLAIINYKYKFVFKFADDDGEGLKYEYHILENLFDEIGPYPVLVDVSKSIFSLAYLIETFVSGKHMQRWFERHLIIFARKIAELHRIKLPFILGKEAKKIKKLNVWEYFVITNEKYFDGTSEMMVDADMKLILPAFQKLLLDNQYLFDALEEFSLIHGNLKPANIVFNETQVFFINWSKAKYFDNARDLATFFYDDMVFANERVKLEKDRKELFIDNYLRAYWKDTTFKQRLDIWIIFDMFCSLVFCKWKYYNFNSEGYEKVMTKRQLMEEMYKIVVSLKNKLKLD
ncbi:MAG: hypothetical protein KC589_08610 [Nanoarchaeota archaeon]|nr:hypothetical protein [Nanoarchaeota archaeon]